MTEPVGLRERKRLATRRSIQAAVLELIQDKGLEWVTIEEISARADVSPRTFFNYFPSKEAAAVGDAPELSPSTSLEEFVYDRWGAGLIADLAHLLSVAVHAADDDVAMIAERRRILRQYPNLFAMRMMSMHRFEDELAALIERRLAQDAASKRAETPTTHSSAETAPFANRARLITLVAFGALRHAWGRWSESDGSVPLVDLIQESFRGLAELVDENRMTAVDAAELGPHL